jgi:NAD(P)-dependent dehydrogenase (short-subunit alcohol dehydrogenase family)
LDAVLGDRTVPAYVVSKGGLAQATKAMANDWAKYGILVNAIGPGWVKTDMCEPILKNQERYAEIVRRIPLGRWADPDEMVGAAVFLASEASNYMTGQTIFVDGGLLSL